MAKIAFILLCHKDPEAVIRLADGLTRTGDYVAIHFDARAPATAYAAIEAGLRANPNVAFARKRVKCGWGEWSLVRATLATVETAMEAFPRATHFYMISGDCRPIKSAEFAHDFLDARDVDYIESVDFHTSGWIKTGMREERLIYRHLFNERSNKRAFYAAMQLQKMLRLERSVPRGIEMMIGSQWWCLRRGTLEKILGFCRSNRAVMRFFSTTWIPDETFFQTLVRHLVPRAEIESRTPTFLMFTDYGMPATFYDDHHDMLLSQDFLFARKISPEAFDLKDRLDSLWASGRTDFPVAGDGRRLFQFLTQRGRVGRRFAPRFWERAATLGRERELVVLVCKKYHVAKRLAQSLRDHQVIPTLDYLFDEEATPMPALGGIESTLGKRHRHRRALLRMLFRQMGTDRLAICLDPVNFDLIEDIYADRATVRTLLIDCNYDDAYLRGHAERIGLIGPRTPDTTVARLMPAVAQDFVSESTRIREAELPEIHRIAETADAEEIAPVLAAVFGTDADTGAALAATPFLFAD
ncbi:DUF5928 domain-containing protein [Jannaschia ovalis]|uniref:Peptide O-xylosyltransferase n=1 Tax=Jannaschia ovalis TaxID=3038773 RepID=A0ABY8LI29_9RHOB|nr:DUF5928 domain-containing protein [Jannaschia sp. GRR-S6-38]WGH79844.1 DUF5928 domain-containing protein [Jannaschia sp. GRR-S6-38]